MNSTVRSSFATTCTTAVADRPNDRDDDDDDDDEQMLLSPANRKNLLTVAILGPPNAGKSTLFNRFVDKNINKTYRLAVERNRKKAARTKSGRLASSRHGSNKRTMLSHTTAIVSTVPGTTRDRRECIGRIGGTYFRLIDTAGVDGERLDCYNRWQQQQQTSKRRQQQQQKQNHINNDPDAALVQAMMRQTSEAALQADLILLLFDARVGVTNDLLETARWLRRNRLKDSGNQTNNSLVVLANKLEGSHWDYDGSPVLDHLTEATRVGFGEVIPISAIHGEGMADIAVLIEECQRAKLEQLYDDENDQEEDHEGVSSVDDTSKVEKPLQLAILGRQNVGKSTLMNALLKQERVITGATPGLTRDAIAVEWSWNGRPVKLVDTAGIRKRSQRDHSSDIEDLAVEDAMRAMKVADVAVLVLDAEARMLQRQELAIADAVLKEGRSLVVVANKMDLIVEDDYTREEFTEAVREQLEGRFPILRKTPVIAMSSLYGDAVDELMPVVFNARDRWTRTVSTGQLNRWLFEVILGNPPPPVAGKPARIKYIIQTKGRPPTFLLFCNVDTLPDHYLRYLTKNFQDTFEMYGMELRFAIKKSASRNPYKPSRRRSGSGLGGRQARKQRTVKLLKKTGSPDQQRRRSRRKNRYT